MTFRCSLVDLSALPGRARSLASREISRQITVDTLQDDLVVLSFGSLFALLSLEVPDAGAS